MTGCRRRQHDEEEEGEEEVHFLLENLIYEQIIQRHFDLICKLKQRERRGGGGAASPALIQVHCELHLLYLYVTLWRPREDRTVNISDKHKNQRPQNKRSENKVGKKLKLSLLALCISE